MRLTFSFTGLGLAFAALVQAGPVTTAGCPDALHQIPTNQGFAAWRWAVGDWQMVTVDAQGKAIDITQVSCNEGQSRCLSGVSLATAPFIAL
jgi:hypothetical protein